MSKYKILLLSIIFLGVLGFVDASYLSYMRAEKLPLPCTTSIFSGCHTVANSPHSILFGVPLSEYGMFFYTVAIGLASINLLVRRQKALLLLQFTTLIGLLSSVYFIYIQGFVIQAFCIYCVFSAFVSTVMAILSTYVVRHTKGVVA